MNRTIAISSTAWLLLGLLFGGPTPSSAQPGPGEIGLYANPDGTGEIVLFRSGEAFSFYVVATPPPTGIKAWEASIELSPEVLVVDVVFDDPRTINVGGSFPPPVYGPNLIVGLGGGCAVGTQPYMLARIDAVMPGLRVPSLACLHESNPSSVGGIGPAYSDCVNQIASLSLATNRYVPPGCIQVGGDCPFFPPDTYIDSASAAGDAGTLVAAPLYLYSVYPVLPDCSAVPYPVDVIRFDVLTDATVATLESVELATPIATWTTTVTRSGGVAHVELTGSPLIDVPRLPPTTYAQLLFRMSDTPGTTTIEFANFVVLDTGDNFLPPTFIGDWAHDGLSELTSLPVSVEKSTFGRIKAKYHD